MSAINSSSAACCWATQIDALDRALGGKIIPGSVILLGGGQGTGKSTLLAQACAGLTSDHHLLLAVNEESVAHRCRQVDASINRLTILVETDVERILLRAQAQSATVLAVDALQVMHDSTFGKTGQLRRCAARLAEFASSTETTTMIVVPMCEDGSVVGHHERLVTLEHEASVILQLEGTGDSRRSLRALKNRYGPTGKICTFEMHDTGLIEVRQSLPEVLREAMRLLDGSREHVVIARGQQHEPLNARSEAYQIRLRHRHGVDKGLYRYRCESRSWLGGQWADWVEGSGWLSGSSFDICDVLASDWRLVS